MHTVIGVFDDRHDAQLAVDRLVQAGIDRDDVHVEHQRPSGETGRHGNYAEDRGSTGKGGLRGFFASLFASEDQANTGHAHTFDEAVRRGSSVVVVDVADGQQAEDIATMLHEMGAVNVDEEPEQRRTEPSLAGSRPVGVGGVRVVERTSASPLRDAVRLHQAQDPATQLREPRLDERARPLDVEAMREPSAREMSERDRALASDRREPPQTQRDPTGAAPSDRTTEPGKRDKPDRSDS